MKSYTCLSLLISALIWVSANGQGGSWEWVRGSTTIDPVAVYGTQGVPAAGNTPGGLYEAASWMDTLGNFWIFGGLDDSHVPTSDLWKYDPVNNEWTWIKGPGVDDQVGTYGTQGVPSLANNPDARGYGSLAWVDNNDDFWLFGGWGDDYNFSQGTFNDLWRYHIATNEWTWMKGSQLSYQTDTYGTLQVPATSNTPGGRNELNSAWVDSSNRLWFFGGQANTVAAYNDVWVFDQGTNNWTWMSGPSGTNHPGTYGLLGIEAAGNLPAARACYTRWKDASGYFYIWGGLNKFNDSIDYSDVWRYDIQTNYWCWVGGDSTAKDTGVYQQYCTYGSNRPMARYENRTAQTQGCAATFLTFGGYNFQNSAALNDLWYYNYQSNQWKWISGTRQFNNTGNYGTMGVASTSNLPPARSGHCQWVDNNNNLWVFGGMNGTGNNGKYNDVWKFIPDTSCLPPASSAAISYLLSDSNLCAGDTALLSVSGVSNAQISPSSSISWNGSSQAFLFPASSTTYTISGNGTCGGTATKQFTVHVSSVAVTVSSDSSTICPADTATICATNGYSAYLWNTGQTTMCINTQSAGEYYVTATNALGCTGQSNQLLVTVYQAPQVGYSQNGDTLAANGAATYQWYYNGQPISGATSQTYIAKGPGTYTVMVTDSNGCAAHSNSIIISGIDNLSDDEISVYPNPLINGSWQLKTTEQLIGNWVDIYDDAGRIIYRAQITNSLMQIDLTVARGIYCLRGKFPLRQLGKEIGKVVMPSANRILIIH